MKQVLAIVLLSSFLAIALGAFGYGYLRYRKVSAALETANERQIKLSADSAALAKRYEDALAQKDDYITFLEAENKTASDTLSAERAHNQDVTDAISGQVSELGKTVSDIQKLQRTDPELLKKYSKIYFLNENYIPAQLAVIPNDHLANKSMTVQANASVLPFLLEMLEASEREASSSLIVISGYRSFAEQKVLKSSYKMTYGSGANKFSADQGYSEHQLGTTFDLSTSKLGLGYTSMAKDPDFKWMQDNAYRFGFILSYPKGNTSYQFEPWHWRFVGIALATYLHDHSMNFYDMDQRQIDAYLIKLFDAN